jgi:hypothetical protein
MMMSVPIPMYMHGYYPARARLNAPGGWGLITRTCSGYSVFLSSAGSSVASS